MAKVFFVGTPIGNLADITLRAIATLQSVDVIACEDTRQARVLLAAHGIEARQLIAHHEFNELSSARGIIDLVKSGKTVALISDAGMPGVSDPGYILMREVLAENISYEVIPGVSAVTMTSMLANMGSSFSFHGFLKPKSGQRQNQLRALTDGLHIIFVSPHQVAKTLADLAAVFGEDLVIFIGRELTKKFETHYRGSVKDFRLKVNELSRGELTVAFKISLSA